MGYAQRLTKEDINEKNRTEISDCYFPVPTLDEFKSMIPSEKRQIILEIKKYEVVKLEKIALIIFLISSGIGFVFSFIILFGYLTK